MKNRERELQRKKCRKIETAKIGVENCCCDENKISVNLKQSVVICERDYRELEISQVTTGFKVVEK